MKFNGWLMIWLVLGGYCGVAAVGGSEFCAAATLYCGFMAGTTIKI